MMKMKGCIYYILLSCRFFFNVLIRKPFTRLFQPYFNYPDIFRRIGERLDAIYISFNQRIAYYER